MSAAVRGEERTWVRSATLAAQLLLMATVARVLSTVLLPHTP